MNLVFSQSYKINLSFIYEMFCAICKVIGWIRALPEETYGTRLKETNLLHQLKLIQY